MSHKDHEKYYVSGNGRFSVEDMAVNSVNRSEQGTWRGTALIVEVLIILVVVVACLGVFAKLFSYAYSSNLYDQHRAHAITLATSEAEVFAAQTEISTGTFTENSGEYAVTSTISSTPSARGTLYNATISVSYEDEEIYTLETAHYISAGESSNAAASDDNAGEGDGAANANDKGAGAAAGESESEGTGAAGESKGEGAGAADESNTSLDENSSVTANEEVHSA